MLVFFACDGGPYPQLVQASCVEPPGTRHSLGLSGAVPRRQLHNWWLQSVWPSAWAGWCQWPARLRACWHQGLHPGIPGRCTRLPPTSPPHAGHLCPHHGPHSESLHVGMTIARVNLQNRHVHLFRFCDRPTMHPWAATLGRDMLVWLSDLLQTPLITPQALAVIRVPASLGGLGFLLPQHEAALHFLQAMLPTAEELPVFEEGDDPIARQMATTLE